MNNFWDKINTFQSTWHPVSEIGSDIKNLSWFLIIMSTFVLVATVILLVLALLKRDKDRTQVFSPDKKFILWCGLYLPTIILLVTFVWSLQSTIRIGQISKEEAGLIIKISAHQYWWEVEYPEHDIITANEIYIPADTHVKFELISRDVIHSLWIPNAHGKIDMLPDHPTSISVNINRPGKYRGQCAEFCGVQHALMAFPLIVLSEHDFNQWLKKHQTKRAQLGKSQKRGEQIYYRESCHTCHAIKGTTFVGKAGPDLTHLASRLTLGAGTIVNNKKNLGEWIINSQKIKPFNRMPSYENLSNDDLQELLNYLGSLK